jgi:hypothetical protein
LVSRVPYTARSPDTIRHVRQLSYGILIRLLPPSPFDLSRRPLTRHGLSSGPILSGSPPCCPPQLANPSASPNYQPHIRHPIEVCNESEKRDKTIKHLEKIMDGADNTNKCLIFTATKHVADKITRFLRQDGWPALYIHGDKAQNERPWVSDQFKTGKK